MPKKRSKSDSEYYKGIIRKLRKQVQQLRKQLETLNNNNSSNTELTLEDVEEFQLEKQPEVKVQMCPSCHRHPLKDFEVLDRKFKICENCAWRSLPEKVENKK